MRTLTGAPTQKGEPKNYFNKEIFVLRLLGLSLRDNESVFYRIYSFLLLVSVSYFYFVIDLREIFKHDFNTSAELIIYEFAALASLTKVIAVFRNRKQIDKLLRKLGEEPFLPNFERGGDVEEKLVNECVWITKTQTLIYWTTAGTTVLVTVLLSIVKRIINSDPNHWQLPYGPLTILNVTYSPNFEISLCLELFNGLCLSTPFTTIDLITASALCHLCTQLKMLQNNLRRIVENAYREMQKDVSNLTSTEPSALFSTDNEMDVSQIPWKYLQISLKKTVNYHLEIIDLSTEMEKYFSNMLLYVFLNALGITSFLVYRTSLLQEMDMRFVIAASEIVIICLEVLLVCYWDEQVIFESQEVGRAVYEANFVGTDLRFQKGLILIMQRSQRPIKLTAGKFTEISLATFTWILRTSYSACMVLRHTNKTEM